MKKIIIVNNNMHIGGVQKALISLLWNIRERYDVTLLLFNKVGECYKDIPPGVKVITLKTGYRFLGMTKYDIRSLIDKLGRSFYAAISRVCGRRFAIALMGLWQKKLSGFDVAISYLHNPGDKVFYGGCNDFVLKHIDAPKKIAFLHCDHIQSGANTPRNNKMYARFDAIAACCNGCAKSFLEANPSLRDKVRVVPNCHRFDEIRRLAQMAPVELPTDKVNVVTVARLGKEKGVERAVRAIAQLGEKQNKLHYYIIGDGIQKILVQQIIDQEKLSHCVTMCGMMDNPYGYIQAADLLLIPSYSEAAPLVIGEAACLGTPMLSTETCAAREMIEQHGYGWVCDNSEKAMCDSLKMLLENRSVMDGIGKHLRESAIDNASSIFEFDRLINWF